MLLSDRAQHFLRQESTQRESCSGERTVSMILVWLIYFWAGLTHLISVLQAEPPLRLNSLMGLQQHTYRSDFTWNVSGSKCTACNALTAPTNAEVRQSLLKSVGMEEVNSTSSSLLKPWIHSLHRLIFSSSKRISLSSLRSRFLRGAFSDRACNA